MATNHLRENAEADRFIITVEYTVPQESEPLDDLYGLAAWADDDPRVSAIGLTDRVLGPECHSPVDVGLELAQRSGKMPLVHVSGKDREPDDFECELNRLSGAGLENILCVTGDQPREERVDSVIPEYQFLDSVNQIHMARKDSDRWLIGAGVSAFKYTEAQLGCQFMKLHKKVAQGAGLIFNQVGYDLRKTDELARYMAHANVPARAICALYWITAGFAKFANTGNVAGVVINGQFRDRIQEICSAPDKGKAARQDMLALHVLLAQRMGYRGAHIGGIKSPKVMSGILDRVDELRAEIGEDEEEMWARWRRLLTFDDGRICDSGFSGDGFYLFKADENGMNTDVLETDSSLGKPSMMYGILKTTHDIIFDKPFREGGVATKIGGFLHRHPLWEAATAKTERAAKWLLVGCEGCGSCSLPETEYVCVEANCGKHCANGPCGGSDLDGHCEIFPEKECAWVEVYRRAKASGDLDELAKVYVPPKDRSLRDTCSWINYAIRRDHHGEMEKEKQ
jgi:methylenetetrahydrofolate reductase (NADPH)